jgi:hypothetical protein
MELGGDVILSLRSIVLGMIIVGVVFFDWGSRNVGSVINMITGTMTH